MVTRSPYDARCNGGIVVSLRWHNLTNFVAMLPLFDGLVIGQTHHILSARIRIFARENLKSKTRKVRVSNKLLLKFFQRGGGRGLMAG